MTQYVVTCSKGTFLVDAASEEQCRKWCQLNYGKRLRFIITEANEYNVMWADKMNKPAYKVCITGGKDELKR